MLTASREKLVQFLEHTHNDEAAISAIVEMVENQLPVLMRQYFKEDFTEIYSETNHNLYDTARQKIFLDSALIEKNAESGGMISRCLKKYSEFLQSKYFKSSVIPKENHTHVATTSGSSTEIEPVPTPVPQKLKEGSIVQVRGTEKHERNKALRDLCIAHYGYVCQVCGFDFQKAYGDLGKDFIEVHHLTPISETEGEHEVDPVNDLVPLCSNCHSMIHRGEDRPLTLEEMRETYKGIKWNTSAQTND